MRPTATSRHEIRPVAVLLTAIALIASLSVATAPRADAAALSSADISEALVDPAHWGGTLAGIRYFRVKPKGEGQHRLWRTDGTPAGTRAVPGAPQGVTAVMTTAARVVVLSDGGKQIWRGTAAGSYARTHTAPTGVSYVAMRTSGATAWLGDGQGRLYRLADTDAAPVEVADSGTFFATTSSGAAYVNGHFYFTGSDSVSNFTLFRVNAITGATAKVTDALSVGSSSFIQIRGVTSDRIYLSRSVGATSEFWSSDGTAAGTVRLLTDTTSTSNEIRAVHGVGQRAYVLIGQFSPRLAVTTGTALTTLTPGAGARALTSSSSPELVTWNNRLAMTVGGTLVVSNGTAAGTTVKAGNFRWPRALGDRLVVAHQKYNDNGAWLTTTTATAATRIATLASPPSVDMPWFVAGGRLIYRLVNSTRSAWRLHYLAPAVPVRNLVRPSVAGKPRTGAKLAVRTGRWDPARPTLTFRWYVGGKAVSNAKGGAKRTFKVTAAHRGKPIHVVVRAAAPGRVAISVSAAKVKAVGTFKAKKRAVLSGRPKVGRTMKAKPPRWSVGGVKNRYQWYAGGKPIKGATKKNWKVTAKYRGKRISVRVVGSKRTYASRAVWSARTAPVKR